MCSTARRQEERINTASRAYYVERSLKALAAELTAIRAEQRDQNIADNGKMAA